MSVENKWNEVKAKPLFEQNCLKIENFQLTIVASLGLANAVKCSFQMKFLTVLIFCLLFHQGKSNNLNHEVVFETHPNETEHIARQQIFTVLKMNPELMENEAVLQAFFGENENRNFGKFDRIEQKIVEGDVTAAQQEITNLETDNPIDQNSKRYYEIYLAMQQTELNETDKTDLLNLSNKCPHIDGAVVFQARALYGALYSYDNSFNPNCDGASGGSQRRMQEQEPTVLEPASFVEKEVLVYPNPNKDKIVLTAKNIQDANIILYDQQGRIVSFEKNVVHEHLIEIPHQLTKGFYTILIENNNEKVVKKLIVE